MFGARFVNFQDSSRAFGVTLNFYNAKIRNIFDISKFYKIKIQSIFILRHKRSNLTPVHIIRSAISFIIPSLMKDSWRWF